MPKDNLVTVPFTREMMIKQCIDNASQDIMEMENIVILARDKDGDVLMWHSHDSRAELVDIIEECKYSIYSGEFFDV